MPNKNGEGVKQGEKQETAEKTEQSDTTEGNKQEPPTRSFIEELGLADLTNDISSLKSQLAESKEAFGQLMGIVTAMANQQAVSQSIAQQATTPDTTDSEPEYPAFDMDEFRRTIGDR